MGGLLSWATGEFVSRHSATLIAKQKLLMVPPGRTNDDMSRGSSLEEFIRSRYETRLTAAGHTWSRRHDLETVMSEAHPGMPWLRGNVDGIYEIDGEVVLVDFKAPSEASLIDQLRSGVEQDYVAQLNHYGLVAQGHGVVFARSELVAFDYRKAGVEDMARPEAYGLRIFPVALDPALQARIATACESFWMGCVMTGELPEDDRSPRLRPENGLPTEIEQAARRAVMAKFMLDAAQARYEDNRGVVSDFVQRTGKLGDGHLKIGAMADGGDGFMKVSAATVFDFDGAIARLRELGRTEDQIQSLRGPGKWENPTETEKKLVKIFDLARDLAALTQPAEIEAALKVLAKATKTPLKWAPGGFDEDLVKQSLVACNEPCDIFLTEKISPVLDRKRRDDLEEMRARVVEGVDTWLGAAVPPVPEAEPAPDQEQEMSGPGMSA